MVDNLASAITLMLLCATLVNNVLKHVLKVSFLR